MRNRRFCQNEPIAKFTQTETNPKQKKSLDVSCERETLYIIFVRFQETEWKQFQSDLLMTVRVANDFKTEAQRELERLVSENKVARDRIRLLEDQMHSLKGESRARETGSCWVHIAL